jgi:HlyD family secretion protein
MDRRVETPWLTRKRLVAIMASAVIATAAIFGYWRYGSGRTLSVSANRVVISTATRGAFHDYIPVTGTVQPRETVYLDAVDGGQIAQILVEEGSMVEQGQPLIRLNNTNLQLQVINSEAQLAEQLNRLASTKLLFEQSRLAHARELIDARFQIEQSEQRLARMRALVNTGAVKRAEIEDVELELQRLQRLQAALAHAAKVDETLQTEQVRQIDLTVSGLNRNLEVARQNLDNLVIKAPIAGQLSALDAHLGESKSQGQRLGQIDQIDGFKVVALVDEHYLPRVTVGERAVTQTDQADYVMEVTKVYPEVKERQFKVDLAFTAAPGQVRRGQSLQLRLEIGAAADALLLANGPFYEETGGEWAFVLPPTGNIAQRRALKLGRRNPQYVEVLEGLQPGERVITSSYESLSRFERIELRDRDA